MELAPEHAEEIVAHAGADAPDVCCGLVGTRDGRSVRVFPMVNAAHSRLRFEVDPSEVARTLDALDAEGLDAGALYHSHTRTAPYPSQTDINYARAWGPDTLWVIVGLAGGEAEVRTYRIDGPDVAQL